jgi:hypothetical protein
LFTEIDFFIFSVYRKYEPRGSANFRPGSNPNHEGLNPMTQADRVLSMPPTNTSKSRRAVLAGIASAAAGGAVAAAIPIAAVAGIPADPAFTLIAEKRAADVAHCKAIDVWSEFEERGDFSSAAHLEAEDNCEAACHFVNEIDWKLANTIPTTLAGVAAVLRFANEIEDAGNEWPNTDTVGPEGWHYQLRATMAAAIEAIIRKGAA